jgi:hypothetical protein
MAVRHLTNANPDGTTFGQSSSDLISFFNATPVAQRAGGAGAGVSCGTTAASTTTPWGFTTSTQANQLTALVVEMRATLVSLGLMAGT